MTREIESEKLSLRKTDLDFSTACSLARNISAIERFIGGLDNDFWWLADDLQVSRTALLNAIRENGNPINESPPSLLERYIDSTLETVQVLAKYRRDYSEKPREFFRQAFRFESSSPDLLQVAFTHQGVYFLVGNRDFEKLKEFKKPSRAFVSPSTNFTSFPDLGSKVGIINVEQQSRIYNLAHVRDKQEDSDGYSLAEILDHEDRHLWYFRNVDNSFSISEEKIDQIVATASDPDKWNEVLKDIVKKTLIRGVMERIAYASANNRFSLSPNQTGKTYWADYFTHLRNALRKYNPPFAAQIRNLWLEKYKEYLIEEGFVEKLARYMMQEVEVIDKTPSLIDNPGAQRKPREKVTHSNLPKEVAEIIFMLMVPDNTEALLQGFGFTSKEAFLEYLKSIEIFQFPSLLGTHHLFEVEEVEEKNLNIKQGGEKKEEILILTRRGFKTESEILEGRIRPKATDISHPPSGPFAQYLEFVENGGGDALILESHTETKATKKDKIVRLVCEVTAYMGDPIQLDGAGLLIADNSTFLNIHLPEIAFVSSSNLSSIQAGLNMIRECFGKISYKLDQGKIDVPVVVAATNYKLAQILTKMGFSIADYLSEGVVSRKIIEEASSHDDLLGQRIAEHPCPVVAISKDEFVKRFIGFYKPLRRIKKRLVESSGF